MRLPCNELPLVMIKETKIQLKDLQVHDMTLPVQSCGYIYNIYIYRSALYITTMAADYACMRGIAASHLVAQG